jgi:hypothetical protein
MAKKLSIEVGVYDLLAISLIVLKLTHVIAWSWWLVLFPIYGVLALCLLAAIIEVFGAETEPKI